MRFLIGCKILVYSYLFFRQALFDTNLPPPQTLMGPGNAVAVSVSGGPSMATGGSVLYPSSGAVAVPARAPSPTEAAAAAILQQQASDHDAFKSALAGFTLREVRMDNHGSSSSRHAYVALVLFFSFLLCQP